MKVQHGVPGCNEFSIRLVCFKNDNFCITFSLLRILHYYNFLNLLILNYLYECHIYKIIL